jgi:4'-phosphopantetheinyl transferase
MALSTPAAGRDRSIWENFPRLQQLGLDEVAVVQFHLDRPDLTPFASVLDDDERRRVDRFVHDVHRRRFVVAHSAVRLILGACLEQPPQWLRFTRTRLGKPGLVGTGELQFNLSHSEDVAILAVARGREVGIDVEQQRPVDVLDLASRFFAPAERESICSLPPHEQESAFFRCWTRKEALVKAIGCGLSMALDAFAVHVDHSAREQTMSSFTADPSAVRRWRITGLPAPDGYTAALAARGQDWRVVRYRDFDTASDPTSTPRTSIRMRGGAGCTSGRVPECHSEPCSGKLVTTVDER